MKISIVIPAHNEGENIEYVLKDILKLNLAAEVVVVDDHSVDNTYEISNSYAVRYSNIKIIQRKGDKKGMGIALREGTLASSGEIIIWMMADRSDDIRTIPLIINKIESGFDLVFASRYMAGGSAGDLNKLKAFLSSSYSFVCKFLFGFRVHDITNAFRGFRKEVFLKIMPGADDFAISPEFAIKSQIRGFRLSEVPTVYTNRKAGKNNFNILKMGLRYASLFKYRYRCN